MAAEWWDTWGKELCLEPSILVVMAVGILGGSILMSITGFGSAIAHICIWSIIKAFGVNVGTLRQAIVTELVYRAVTSIPYLSLTNAKKTANVKLAVSISFFQALGSPVGSYLLLVLDQQKLELCLAGVLILVLLAQATARFVRPQSKTPIKSRNEFGSIEDSDSDSELNQPLLLPKDQAIIVNAGEAEQHTEQHGNSIQTSVTQNGVDNHDLVHGHYVGPVPALPDQQGAVQTISSQQGRLTHGLTVEDGFLYLPTGKKGGTSTDSTSPASSGGLSHSSTGLPMNILHRPGDCHSWIILLLIGSVAGTLSGIMGGLTAINGPPTIVMFNMLEADKVTVRGTNAISNVVLAAVLLAEYVVAGVFTWKDSPLYVIGAIFGFIGTFGGNSISHKMSQQTFGRVLTGMVVVCVVLMLASGLGLNGRQ